MSVRDFDQVLTTTRAVRKRLDLERPVEPAVISECIELAAQAPIGSNIHSWRFLVVTDPELRTAIGGYYRRGASEYLAAGRARASTPAQRRVSDSSTYLMENFHRVPVHVLALMKGRPPRGDDQALAGYYGSVMPAIWSFALALRSRGLGSAWTTLHLAYEREVAELLGIPDNVTQVALLPVAYTIGQDFKPAARPPLERLASWNRYGDSAPPACSAGSRGAVLRWRSRWRGKGRIGPTSK
jgi:nitroreductase